jgi:hypothetical protein
VRRNKLALGFPDAAKYKSRVLQSREALIYSLWRMVG